MIKTLRIFIFVALALGSCAPLFSGIPLRMPPADPSLPIQIEGEDTESVLMRLMGEPCVHSDAFPVKDVLRIEQAIADRPLVSGNRLELLIDGPQTFKAMFAAMRSARHHIHIETFIIDDDEIGAQLADILIDRREAGVEVRLLYDAVGALLVQAGYFDRLREKGVQLHEYHPISPADIIRINNRHHRKIAIVDGRIGFIGGLNISGVYAIPSSGHRKNSDKGWRDTHLKVEGPIVAHLQRLFVELWARVHDAPPLDNPNYFPPLDNKGHQLVRLVDSMAGRDDVDNYALYLAVIEQARERIWITQGYFSPDARMLDALKDAAGRNVDVRLLLPGLTDSWITINSSRAHYSELLKAGVRVFERRDALQHAKTAVIDGIWSTVGSTNLDYRSFLHSNEANLVVWGRDFANEMETMFLADQERNMEIDLREWQRRFMGRRVLEFLASLFDYWL